MNVRRGDLYWIDADALSPAVPGVAHPYVVVQDDVLNASRIATVVVCALSSRLGRAREPGSVLLDDGEGGLPQRSVVVVSQICVVAKDRLGEPMGQLSAARVEQVLTGLRFQQRSFGVTSSPPPDKARAVALAEAPGASVEQVMAAAYACDRVGAEAEAIVWYDRAFERGVPADERDDFMVGYGSTLRNVGRTGEAIAVLRGAVEATPDSSALLAFLALALHSEGRADDSVAAALQALLVATRGTDRLGGYDRALRAYRDELTA